MPAFPDLGDGEEGMSLPAGATDSVGSGSTGFPVRSQGSIHGANHDWSFMTACPCSWPPFRTTSDTRVPNEGNDLQAELVEAAKTNVDPVAAVSGRSPMSPGRSPAFPGRSPVPSCSLLGCSVRIVVALGSLRRCLHQQCESHAGTGLFWSSHKLAANR